MKRLLLKSILSATFMAAICCHSGFAADDAQVVADELNALYSKTSACEDGKPDYYCSGIVLSIQWIQVDDNNNIQFPIWYLPNRRTVGSFSYIRKDLTSNVGHPMFLQGGFTGIILTPLTDIQSDHLNQFNYHVYCSYPWNGSSNGRSDSGCGDFKMKLMGLAATDIIDYSNCSQKGITSVSQYTKAYLKESPFEDLSYGNDENQFPIKLGTEIYSPDVGCSFSPDAAGFRLSMNVFKYAFRDHPEIFCSNEIANSQYHGSVIYTNSCNAYNELVISAWPEEKVDITQVPIKAFFVTINNEPDDSLNTPDVLEYNEKTSIKNIFLLADAYQQATHQQRSIPVVSIDIKKLKAGEADIFAPAVRPHTTQ